MKELLLSLILGFGGNGLTESIQKSFGKSTLAKIKRHSKDGGTLSFRYCTHELDKVIIKSKKKKEILSFYYSSKKYNNTGNGIVTNLSRRLRYKEA